MKKTLTNIGTVTSAPYPAGHDGEHDVAPAGEYCPISHASHTLVVHELHVTGQYCSAKALVSVRVQRFKVPKRGEKALVILAQLVTVPGSTATESRSWLESAAVDTMAASESAHERR